MGGGLDALYESHYAGFQVPERYRRALREELAATIRSRLPPPADVLDVGCGGGEFLAAATEAGYRARGVDVSAAAVAICRGRGLDASVGDIPDGAAFDLVTFWDVLEHVPDPRAFLRRAHAALRPGGWVLVKSPGPSELSLAVAAALPRLAGAVLQAPAHVQFFRAATLTAILHAEGFTALEWPGRDGMRSPTTGGPLRRRLARRAVAALQRAGGDRNLYVVGRRV